MRRMVVALGLVASVAVSAVSATASVTPDDGFAGDGTAVLTLTNGYFADVATVGNSVIAAGTNGFDTLVVAKYDRRGELDTSFANGGVRRIDMGDYFNPSSFVAIDSEGRILAGGADTQGVVIARLLPDGTRDDSFGSNGLARDSNGGTNYSITVDASDRPVVAYGTANDIDDKNLHVLRFTDSGELDESLAGDGDYRDLTIASALVGAVATDAENRILLLSHVLVEGGGQAIGVLRLDSEGTALTQLHRYNEAGLRYPTDLVVTDDGQITGVISQFTGRQFLVHRLTQAGTPDATFSEDGQVIRTCDSQCKAFALVVGANGATTLSGSLSTNQGTQSRSWVGRLKPSGDWSAAFAKTGLRTPPLFDTENSALAVALDAADRVILAGWRTTDHADGYVARLIAS